ncbi:amidohydrolase family protein [Chloroflexota bacterium]
MMKIDVFPHCLPKKYIEAFHKKVRPGADSYDLSHNLPLSEIDIRLRLMDRYPDVVQVLTVALPPLETRFVTPSDAVELAKIANDEMADLVAKYPDRFIAAVACLPMNDIDAAIKEADRAITELRFRGVQIFSTIDGEPLDTPKFRPLYARMAQHDLPIWIHPWDPPLTGPSTKDLPKPLQERLSERTNDRPMGGLVWPFETSLAMMRLRFSGVFDDYPDIKFITHHCGGMVPFFAGRPESLQPGSGKYLRKFYNDTAVYGNTSALMCGYDFFGADHLLFGTDMPLGGGGWGFGRTLETIRSIERMDIPAIDKDKIFFDNARQLLRLPL